MVAVVAFRYARTDADRDGENGGVEREETAFDDDFTPVEKGEIVLAEEGRRGREGGMVSFEVLPTGQTRPTAANALRATRRQIR